MKEKPKENRKYVAPLIKKLNEIIERKANRNFKKMDITFSQLQIITILYSSQNEAYTLKELEIKFNVSQQTMAGIVKRLENKKIIQSISEEKDKRIKKIKLTKKRNDNWRKV